ncbi:Uncharacterised protein [uncultured archaeon]|nr:Uncharacterised protein [uncultured archaeon]
MFEYKFTDVGFLLELTYKINIYYSIIFLFEVGYALLILTTYRSIVYQEMINIRISINIELLIVVSMLNVGVGEVKLLVGNEEAPRFSD